jgi:hypothetical protein
MARVFDRYVKDPSPYCRKMLRDQPGFGQADAAPVPLEMAGGGRTVIGAK